ncbi:MAG: hypothetical protein LBD55_04710 [Treponema sp.]|nr:hypothetical protein [Treponema sp.]
MTLLPYNAAVFAGLLQTFVQGEWTCHIKPEELERVNRSFVTGTFRTSYTGNPRENRAFSRENRTATEVKSQWGRPSR